MKFRTDFVTNSSSSCFITVSFRNDAMNEIMTSVVQKHIANQELRDRICRYFTLYIDVEDEIGDGDGVGAGYGIRLFTEDDIFDNHGYLPKWFIGCYRSLFLSEFTRNWWSYYDEDDDDECGNEETEAEDSDPKYVGRGTARVIINEFAKEVMNNWEQIKKKFGLVELRTERHYENETRMNVLKIDGYGNKESLI